MAKTTTPRQLSTPAEPLTLERLLSGGDREKFPFELEDQVDGWYVSQSQAEYRERALVRVSPRAHNWKLTRRDIYFEVEDLDGLPELWHGVLYGEGTRFLARPLGRAQRRRQAALQRRRSLKAAGLAPCARCDTPTDPALLDVVSYCPTCSEITRDPGEDYYPAHLHRDEIHPETPVSGEY